MQATHPQLPLGAPPPIFKEGEGLLADRKVKKDPVFPVQWKILMVVAPLLPVALGLFYHFGCTGALSMPDWAQKAFLASSCVTGASQGIVYLFLTYLYCTEKNKQKYLESADKLHKSLKDGNPGPDPAKKEEKLGQKSSVESSDDGSSNLDELD